MVNVFLVRHASTPDIGIRLSGRTPVGLSAAGLEEARAVGETLAPLGILAIYTSPLRRARDTAELISRRCGPPVQVSPRANEIDFGAWTGRAFTDLADSTDWQRFNQCPERAVIPSGETLQAVADRAAMLVRTIGLYHGRGNVIVVTHGDVIRLGLARLLSVPWHEFRRFEIEPASVTCVRVGGPAPSLVCLNHRPDAWRSQEFRAS